MAVILTIPLCGNSRCAFGRGSLRLEKSRRVMMTAEARELWEHAYETLSHSKPGLLGAILGRAEAQTVRLALIYALLDGSDQIGVEHLNAALSVWSYCEASAGYVFGGVVAGKTEDVISAALGQAGETGMTRTEIRDLFGRHRKGHEIDAALAALAASRRPSGSSGLPPAAVPPRCGSNCVMARHMAPPFDWRSGVRHKRRKRRNPQRRTTSVAYVAGVYRFGVCNRPGRKTRCARMANRLPIGQLEPILSCAVVKLVSNRSVSCGRTLSSPNLALSR